MTTDRDPPAGRKKQTMLQYARVLQLIVMAVAAAGISAVGVGCSSLASATAGYGDTSTVVPVTGDLATQVAEQMLLEYEFQDVTATSSRLDGRVTGTTGNGETISIMLEPAGARTTRVTVSNNAGKTFAEVVLRGIERRLDDRTLDPAGGEPRQPALDPAEAEQRREAELRELERSLGM